MKQQRLTELDSLRLPAAAALATALLLTPMAMRAQSTAQQASPYQGVSTPPPDDTIEASTEPAAQPAHSKPSPATPTVHPNDAAPASSTHAPSTANDPKSSDYGVVYSSAESHAAPLSREAHLIARPDNPDFDAVSVVPSPSNQLAEGTDIRVRLLDGLSTGASQDGSSFRAQVAADVFKEGRVVIPVGSELRGRVISVTQGHRLGAPATMRLRPETVLLPDGSAYHLYAQAIHTDAPGTRTDAEGGIQPTSRVTRSLVELGAGSGGGAVTGAIFGGPVGAGVGALVGAGIVTAHLLLQHPHEAHVEQGSEVTFSLTEPMDLLPTRN